jgi:hypothetical protein
MLTPLGEITVRTAASIGEGPGADAHVPGEEFQFGPPPELRKVQGRMRVILGGNYSSARRQNDF